MYIVLNYKLEYTESEVNDTVYHISCPLDRHIILDAFNAETINTIVKSYYKLGEEIHVYAICEDEFRQNTDTLKNKISYDFKIRKEVPFWMLRDSSDEKNLTTIRIYQFCSMVKYLIAKGRFEECIKGLIDALELEELLEVLEFLKDIPKSDKEQLIIENSIEEIKSNALLKYLNCDTISIDTMINLLSNNKQKRTIIISKMKSQISSRATLEDLENDIDFLERIHDKSVLSELSIDYINKLTLLYLENYSEDKDYLKQCKKLAEKLIECLKLNKYDSSELERKYAILKKQERKYIFS